MKTRAKKVREHSGSGVALAIVKGSVIALCVSLIGVLIFAFCLKFTPLSDKLIAPINQVIKGLSIFLGVLLALKKRKDMGLVSGLSIGFIYTIVAFLVFSALSGSFIFDRTLLNDVVFGAIIGGICGIICVNIKKSGR